MLQKVWGFAGGYNIFAEKSYPKKKFFFLIFFFELSHSESKKRKKFFLPIMRSRDLRLRIFLKILKIFDFFFVYFFELTNSESKKTKKIFLSIMRSRHQLRLRIFSTNLKSFSIVKFLKSLNVLKVCFQFQQVEQVNKVN